MYLLGKYSIVIEKSIVVYVISETKVSGEHKLYEVGDFVQQRFY